MHSSRLYIECAFHIEISEFIYKYFTCRHTNAQNTCRAAYTTDTQYLFSIKYVSVLVFVSVYTGLLAAHDRMAMGDDDDDVLFDIKPPLTGVHGTRVRSSDRINTDTHNKRVLIANALSDAADRILGRAGWPHLAAG